MNVNAQEIPDMTTDIQLRPSDQAKQAWMRLATALDRFNETYDVIPYVQRPICIPGIGDVFIRRVTRLGYKGAYPRPYDWENLVPQLREGEELLWIVRKRGGRNWKDIENASGANGQYEFEVYLGLKFTGDPPRTREDWENRGHRFAALTRHFSRGAFPETRLEQTENEIETASFFREISDLKHARIVTGMPSFKEADLKETAAKRNEDSRPYAGLNDFLEMHGGPEDDFAIVFSVSKVSPDQIQRNFNTLFTIRNTIQPLLKNVVQYSENESLGHASGEQVTVNEGSTDQIKGGEKIIKGQRGLFPRMGRSIMNVFRAIGGSKRQEFDNQKYEKVIGAQQTHGISTGITEQTTETTQKGKSWSVTEVNSALAFADDRITETLAQLTQTLGTGGYSCGAVVYSDSAFTVENLSGAICSTLSGGHSPLYPMRSFEFELQNSNRDWLRRRKSLATAMAEDGIQSGILNCEKACLFLPVPTTHLVGLPLKKNVFYGKEKTGEEESGGITVGSLSFAETHIAGEKTRFCGNESHLDMKMAPRDFYSHCFIVGTTGCGKTTRAAKILHDAEGFRRIILETAKKTYWNEIGLKPDELLVYTLGDSTRNPLRFNPFYFEKGASLKQHIAVLADAISDLLPMEALIGPKLREAVERCYESCGWNIETGERDEGNGGPEYPDVTLFRLMVWQVAEELSDYGAEVRGNYKGALLNRAAIFTDAVFQDIFAFDGNKTIDELFPPDKTVIVEMEEMPPSEINMPAFLVSLILQRIRARQSLASRNGSLEREPGFLVAIEEAHNVLSRDIQSKHDETQSGKGGHLVKQVSRLLAEGRGLKIGLMIIDQSAANIAPGVITNTNTKFVFRQEDGTEIETIGKAIGLTEKTWGDLQLLEQGEYLLRNGKYPQPVKMAPLAYSELVRSSDSNRDDYVSKARWIPPYREMEREVKTYCRTIGKGQAMDANGEISFIGLGSQFDKSEEGKNLDVLCMESPKEGNKCFHADLRRYMIVKTLLGLGYYQSAKRVFSIH